MTTILKRTLLALAIGFVLNALVVLALAEIPRRLDIGVYQRKQVVWRDAQGAQQNVYVTRYRWVGVLETQLHDHRRAIAGVRPSSASLWFAWTPFFAEPADAEAFGSLKQALATDAQGDPIDPGASVYSTLSYGLPAVCVRARAAINDAAVFPDGSYARAIRGAVMTPVIDPDRLPYQPPAPGAAGAKPLAGASKASTSPIARFVWFPYAPHWPGLLINTIFYAMLALIAMSVLRAFRHARRMRRGRCPVCRYELGFDFRAGCPECGWRKGGATTSPS